MKDFKINLPPSFTKKYKNAKLLEILSEEINWGMGPLSYDAKGRRKMIQINSLLFDFIETHGNVDFYLEPYDELFEMMPPWVSRQGIGFSVDQQLGGLELDVHFFPCDYSDDQRRHLPFAPVHVPIAVIFDYDVIDRLVKKQFLGSNPPQFRFHRTVLLSWKAILWMITNIPKKYAAKQSEAVQKLKSITVNDSSRL